MKKCPFQGSANIFLNWMGQRGGNKHGASRVDRSQVTQGVWRKVDCPEGTREPLKSFAQSGRPPECRRGGKVVRGPKRRRQEGTGPGLG